MSLKKRIFIFVSSFYIIFVTFPLFGHLIPIPIWIVNLFVFLSLFLIYPNAYLNKTFFWFFIYAIVLFLFVLFNKPLTIGIGTVTDSKKIIIEYAFLLPTLSIFSILHYLRDSELIRKISFVGVFSIFASFLFIIPQIFSDSLILRNAYNLYATDAMITPGIPNYLIMHAYTLIVSPIIYGIKISPPPRKWILFFSLIILLYVILNTYVTTSLMLVLAILVISIVYSDNNRIRSFLIAFLSIFLLLILHLSGIFVQLFDFLIDFFEGTAVQPKIEAFKYIYLFGDIEQSGGHITGRMNLHDMSWKAFSENFLIGGTSPVGGHSQLIDRLGGMGLVAFIPFIMMIFAQIKMVLKLITNSEQRLFYYLGLGVAFAILYQKGLFGQEGWFFLMILLPGLLISFRNSSMGDNLTQDIK